MNTKDYSLTIKGELTHEIQFNYFSGGMATLEDPAEPAEISDISIISTTDKGEIVADALTDEEIETLIWENASNWVSNYEEFEPEY